MTMREFIGVVELPTKVVSLSSFTLGTLFAAASAGRISPFRVVIMLLATLAVDMGTTAWNTYFDFLRSVDDSRFNRERNKVLVHGGVPPSAALAVSLLLFGAAVLLGLVLALLSGLWIAAAGAVCMAVGFLYNGGPFPISRTPFGEVFAGGFLGTALFLISFGVQAFPEAPPSGPSSVRALLGPALLAGLPSLLFIASILTANNTCDVEGDTAAGRRTLTILLGRRAGEILVYVQGLGAFAILASLGCAGVLPAAAAWAAAAVGAAASLKVYAGMRRRGYSHATKEANMKAVLLAFLLFSSAYAAILVFSLLREPAIR